MEQDKNVFIEDSIDLDEIRELLGDVAGEPTGEPTAEPEADIPEADLEDLFLGEDAEVEWVDSLPDDVIAELENDITEELPEGIDLITEGEGPAELFEEMSEAQQEVPAEKKKKGSFLLELYGMLHDVIYLLAAVTLVFVFVVRLVGVQGDSMLPTLHNRDYLVLESNFLFGGRELEYGDVVVLNVPHYQHGGEGPIVKRVIATEGQTVDIDFENGIVYVDGVRLVEDYINAPTYYNWDGELALDYPATVPEGCVFVLGDNRNNSMDSRYAPIGMVNEQYVLGKVLFIALPGQTTDEAGNVIDSRDWGRIGLVS